MDKEEAGAVTGPASCWAGALKEGEEEAEELHDRITRMLDLFSRPLFSSLSTHISFHFTRTSHTNPHIPTSPLPLPPPGSRHSFPITTADSRQSLCRVPCSFWPCFLSHLFWPGYLLDFKSTTAIQTSSNHPDHSCVACPLWFTSPLYLPTCLSFFIYFFDFFRSFSISLLNALFSLFFSFFLFSFFLHFLLPLPSSFLLHPSHTPTLLYHCRTLLPFLFLLFPVTHTLPHSLLLLINRHFHTPPPLLKKSDAPIFFFFS